MARKFRFLLVHGPHALVRGFVSGFLTGRKVSGLVFYAEEAKLEGEMGEEEGLAEKVVEWIGLHQERMTKVAVEEKLHGPLVEAIRKSAEETGLSVEASRVVKEACFAVKFEAFSAELGSAIRKIFDRPPAGVRARSDFGMEEKRREDAAGPEGYAPEHEYELRGAGTFCGPLEKIVAFQRLAGENALIHCDPIRLDLE